METPVVFVLTLRVELLDIRFPVNGITIRLSARQDILVLPLSRLLRENSLALSSLMRASNLLIKLQLPLSDKYHNSFRGGSVLVSQLVLIVTKLDGIIVMLRME